MNSFYICICSVVKDEDMVALKMRGVPFSAMYDEIESLMDPDSMIPRSLLFGLKANGKRNGYAALLCKDAATATKMQQHLNKKYVRDRYLDVGLASYADYQEFNVQR